MQADLGMAFDGRAPITELLEQARLADTSGASTLWMASHLFLRDPITMANAALAATRRTRVALMAMSPYLANPAFIAMTAAALEELYPGRVVLCLGAGAPGDLAAAGTRAIRPLATLRESIQICRALLAGKTIAHDGEIFKMRGRALPNPAPNVPIVLAASGPQMLELAGAEADGAIISAATCVPFVRESFDRIACGEARRVIGGRCKRHVIVYTRMADSERVAIDGIRRTMGFILRGPHHAGNVALGRSGLDQQRLWDAYAAQDWPAVEQLVTDEVVRPHAAVGTAVQIRARYDDYASSGADEVIIGGIDHADETARVLTALAHG